VSEIQTRITATIGIILILSAVLCRISANHSKLWWMFFVYLACSTCMSTGCKYIYGLLPCNTNSPCSNKKTTALHIIPLHSPTGPELLNIHIRLSAKGW